MLALLKRRRATPGLTAIGLLDGGVCLVQVARGASGRPQLTACEYRPWGADGERKVLTRLAADHGLKRARCTTLLAHNDYSLLVTEAPEVEAGELKTALRWRVKDLIDFPVDEATIDVFDVPGTAVSGRAREMYAVAARNPAVQRQVDLLTRCGVNLDIIDIPEMAQRNLAALLAVDERGVVLLSFTAHTGLMTLTKNGELYLSRHLDVGLELLRTADASGHLGRIVLEVQRSLDYFENHFRTAPINHLVLSPSARNIPGLAAYLGSNLSVKVEVMDLGQLLDYATTTPAELETVGLATLGAALRRETVAP